MKITRLAQRKFLFDARKERLTGGVYSSLVDSLFCGTLVSFAALAIASMTLASVNFAERPDVLNVLLLSAMTVMTGLRVALMYFYHRWRRRGRTLLREVVQWETLYTIHGVIMMGVIGLLSVATAVGGATDLSLLVSVIVVMGIIGGIAGRNGSRPKIVRYQMIALMLPFQVALIAIHTTATLVAAVLILAYYAAMMSSTVAVYTALRTALINESRNKDLSRRIIRSTALFDIALNNMTSGLMLFDRERRLVVANDRVKALMGHQLIDAMMGQPIEDICQDLFIAYDTAHEEADRIASTFPALMKRGDGAITFVDHVHNRSFELRLRGIPDQGVVVNVDDVTEKLRKEEEVRHLAHHDALTGLFNRFSLGKFVERCALRAQDESNFVMMYLDLDHFKEINDDLGHGAGDSVLIQVAQRLKHSTRASDFVARLAGDEFVVVFPDVEDLETFTAIAQDIIKVISEPYMVCQRWVTIGASAGLSLSTQGITDPHELLRLADVALYEAKKHGRGMAMWYDHEMDSRASARREMTQHLRDAIDNGELKLNYQPVIDLRTGQIVACEALARWTHAGVPISPGVFIPLAEESDLIHKLGVATLTRACLEAKNWKENIKVAVNLSVSQFKRASISATILKILAMTDLDPSRLEIEITESVLADDLDLIRKEMELISQAGVSIALDDFGTGYSSLSLLHSLPIDKVKLDLSFVAQLETDPSAISLIATIVQMAQTMRKQLVIEGVETAGQLAQVASVNARLVQGYYFSKPLSAEAIGVYLAQNEEDAGAGLLYAGVC